MTCFCLCETRQRSLERLNVMYCDSMKKYGKYMDFVSFPNRHTHLVFDSTFLLIKKKLLLIIVECDILLKWLG